MSGLFDTHGKNTVRSSWNTPFLKYLHDKYGYKYRYLGLPSTDLEDIEEWGEMLKEVIAFELPDEGDDERKSIKTIKKKLILKSLPHDVFCGAIEQVITSGVDLDGKPYAQSNCIDLYNLDFCSEITSKLPGSPKRLRYELIRKILRDQNEIYSKEQTCKRFIILLTARNQFFAPYMKKQLYASDLISSATMYLNKVKIIGNKIPSKSVSLIGTHGWALKTFIYNMLHLYFNNPSITSYIFPMVKYDGRPIDEDISSPMIHWMIYCKFGGEEAPSAKLYPPRFLYNSSLKASKSGILNAKEPAEKYVSSSDPVELFMKSEHYFHG